MPSSLKRSGSAVFTLLALFVIAASYGHAGIGRTLRADTLMTPADWCTVPSWTTYYHTCVCPAGATCTVTGDRSYAMSCADGYGMVFDQAYQRDLGSPGQNCDVSHAPHICDGICTSQIGNMQQYGGVTVDAGYSLNSCYDYFYGCWKEVTLTLRCVKVETIPMNNTCGSNSDCPLDYICSGGRCTFPRNCTQLGGESSSSAQCQTASDCTGGNECKTASCIGGACVYTNRQGTCSDDGNSCTDNECVSGVCTHPPVADGTLCGAPVDPVCAQERCVAGTCAAPGAFCSCATPGGSAFRSTLASLVDTTFGTQLAAGSCTNNDTTSCDFENSCGRVKYTNSWSGPGCCDGGGGPNTQILTADPGKNYATIDFKNACNGAGTGSKQIPVCPCSSSSSSRSSSSSSSSQSSSSSSSSRSSSSSSRSSSSSSRSSSLSSLSSSSSVVCTPAGRTCSDCQQRTICVTCPNAGPNDACTQSCKSFTVVNRYPDGTACTPCTVQEFLNEPAACPASSAGSSASGGSGGSNGSNGSGGSNGSNGSGSSGGSNSSGSSGPSSGSSSSGPSSGSSSSRSSSSSSNSSSSSSSSSGNSSSQSSSSNPSSGNSSSSQSSNSSGSSNSSSSSSSSNSSNSSGGSSSSSSAAGFCCIGQFCGGPVQSCTNDSCAACVTSSASSALSGNSSSSSSAPPSNCPVNACANGGQAFCENIGQPVCTNTADVPCIVCSGGGSSSSAHSANNCPANSCANGGQVFCDNLELPVCTNIPDIPCVVCSGGGSSASAPQSSSNNSSSSSAPCLHICGNGERECTEECDDGNIENDDGCSTTCFVEGGFCGDGIIESRLGETCEPVLTDPSSDCDADSCTLITQNSSSSLRYAICGNGRREGFEECDDGTRNGTDTSLCSTSCQYQNAFCGDGIVESRLHEDCEPSLVSPDAPFACTSTCQFIYASSSAVSVRSSASSSILANACTGTECSDGGNDFCASQDAVCSTTTTLPCIQCIPNDPSLPPFIPGFERSSASRSSSKRSSSSSSLSTSSVTFIAAANCGNGILNAGEQCDQGLENSTSQNAFCRPDCTFGRCGDGVLDTPLETCDLGSQNGLLGSTCTALCRLTSEAASVLPASVIELPFSTMDSSCTVDADCPAGMRCFQNRCVNAANLLICKVDADCPAGMVCFQNRCVNSANLLLCKEDKDCAAGMICLNGMCTAPALTTLPPSNANSGPATIAIMAMGASAGYAWMKKKRK